MDIENKEEQAGAKAAPETKTKKTNKDKIAKLEKELEDQKALLEAEKNDYLRLAADFDTFRRRTAADRLELVANAASDTIRGMLPVLDDCERAMEMLEKSSDEAAKEGTALIYNKLMAYLKSKGLEPMKAKGEKFDTDFHEAVAQFPVQDEEQKGKVFDVVETGYMFAGKVLRYAKVVVGI